MPAGTRQLCPDRDGKFAKAIRCKSEIVTPINITYFLPDLGVEICDAVFGSLNP